jgi:hypothetical protein
VVAVIKPPLFAAPVFFLGLAPRARPRHGAAGLAVQLPAIVPAADEKRYTAQLAV